MTLVPSAPLSSWWGARHHRALGTTTDKAVRLAIALGAVKSIIRVVDRSNPRMTVDWAAHDPRAAVKSMSYTDFQHGQIKLNPGPILDPAIDHGRALDIVSGFGLHEASHSQESRDRYKYLVKKEPAPVDPVSGTTGYVGNVREVPAFSPMRIAAYLWNLVEDVRIEAATSKHWPGFRPYFQSVLTYMWSEMRRVHEVPTTYGPTLTDKLRVVYLACRYPAVSLDPSLSTEVAWWQAWQADYLSDAVDTPTTIQRGLDHLAEDAATKQELDEQGAAERRERAAGERLRDQINRLIREGIKGGFEVCAADNGEVVPLDEATAEAVRQLVREGLIETRTIVTGQGVSLAPVRVRRPEETPESRRAYVGRPDAATEALRAALVFRVSAPQHDEKLLKAGHIDDEELYRWGLNDYRVFSERVVESKPDVFLGLLCDISGSMSGAPLRTVQRLAQLLTWAVADQEGIETAVWAHTTDLGDDAAEIYRIWAKGDPLSRLGLLSSLYNGNNRDSQVIEWCVTQIAQTEQPEHCLIVLSDGQPSGSGYGGRSAMQHVRAVTKWAQSRGVRVIQVACGHDLRMADQITMFGEGNVVPFTGYQSLPRQLAAVLGRYL